MKIMNIIIIVGCILAVLIVNIVNAILEHKRNKIIEKYLGVNKQIKRENRIMKAYLQMIMDKCFDYDGYDKVKDLKGLIDEIDYYARLGRDCNDNEVCYRDIKGNVYNILDEKIGGDKNDVKSNSSSR